MEIQEYLLSYGALGDFGRFRPLRPLTCRRGDRAVVRSHRGLELGVVLCAARPGHAHFLPNTTVGQLLHLACAADEQTAEQMRQRAQAVFDDASRLARESALPVQMLDAEVLLDGQHGVVHLLRTSDCDVRALVDQLSQQHGLHLEVQDLAHPAPADEHEHGCGRADCGRTEGGGGTCGSGGGCSSCGVAGKQDMTSHFAELRDQMEEQRRVALL